MEQRSTLPQFGNWDSEENYTVFFDKARKGRSREKIVNPNDPHHSQDMVPHVTSTHAFPFKPTSDLDVPSAAAMTALTPKHERRTSSDDADVRRLTDSPVYHETGEQRASIDLQHQQYGHHGMNSMDQHKRGRLSGGTDCSTEHSPLHPHFQAKAMTKGGVSSPAWERKGSSEGSHSLAASTPNRSRLRPSARGDETPEKGAAVPKFGDWDESDPASADGFTHIFEKVKAEKHMESAKVPVMPLESPYHHSQKQGSSHEDSARCCCFAWSRN